MSIPPSGSVGISGGIVSAIGKNIRLLRLNSVSHFTIQLDPFHPKSTETRFLSHFLSSSKVQERAQNCRIRTNIVCDRSEPLITARLIPEAVEKLGVKQLTIKANNLSCLEILQICNKHLTPLIPIEEPDTSVKTKATRKVVGGKGKK